MACFTRCASAAGVSYLHFEAVGPTVPCSVPGRFDGAPIGRTNAFSGRLARECGCARRGSLIGHHRAKSTLNVLDGLGEGSICSSEVVNGGVLVGGRVGKVVQGCDHLLCLFQLCGLVGTKGGFASCHAGDVTHFGKCSRPVHLPVCPCVLICWAVLPFSPAEHHVAAGKRVLGAGGDHQFVRDRDACVGGKDLTLVPCLQV